MQTFWTALISLCFMYVWPKQSCTSLKPDIWTDHLYSIQPDLTFLVLWRSRHDGLPLGSFFPFYCTGSEFGIFAISTAQNALSIRLGQLETLTWLLFSSSSSCLIRLLDQAFIFRNLASDLLASSVFCFACAAKITKEKVWSTERIWKCPHVLLHFVNKLNIPRMYMGKRHKLNSEGVQINHQNEAPTFQLSYPLDGSWICEHISTSWCLLTGRWCCCLGSPQVLQLPHEILLGLIQLCLMLLGHSLHLCLLLLHQVTELCSHHMLLCLHFGFKALSLDL